MIISAGVRTDIPAFYSRWFYNRIAEEYVLVRNPYNSQLITRYELNPNVVDLVAFCTKNPRPMLPGLNDLKDFRSYWFVTVTPYGRDLEPGVPPWRAVVDDIKFLSKRFGKKSLTWRYDPVILTDRYTRDLHLEWFAEVSALLETFVSEVVVSFVDIYPRMKKTCPDIKPISLPDQKEIAASLVRIASRRGMKIRVCAENPVLASVGASIEGCFSQRIIEDAIGDRIVQSESAKTRSTCLCSVASRDIGCYNCCPHLCRYCYANSDQCQIENNLKIHDPDSPLLLGHLSPEDKIIQAKQESIINRQLTLF